MSINWILQEGVPSDIVQVCYFSCSLSFFFIIIYISTMIQLHIQWYNNTGNWALWNHDLNAGTIYGAYTTYYFNQTDF